MYSGEERIRVLRTKWKTEVSQDHPEKALPANLERSRDKPATVASKFASHESHHGMQARLLPLTSGDIMQFLDKNHVVRVCRVCRFHSGKW